MLGRTRRARLLALVACIVIVFFLYERSEVRVERYADYLTSTAGSFGAGIGGGAVLRPSEQQEQQPLPEPPKPDEWNGKESVPAPKTAPKKVVEPESASSTLGYEAPAPSPLITPAPTSSQSEAVSDKTTPTYNGAPQFYGGPVVEVGEGRVEQEPSKHSTSSKPPPIHWTKLPEKFPISSTIQLPTSKPSPIPLVQKGKGSADQDRLLAIKEACKHAWKGFRAYGWGYDEVRPVSGKGQNSFNGWGATLVDSLDTLWIMGMKEEFEEAVNKAAEIDFTTSPRNDIPMFEVTIRYLGGLIAAYDVSGKQYRILLDKAVELAEVLYSAFDTPNRMPETYYYWKPTFASNAHRASTRVVMAELGTLSLEFTRLAQLTGEPKYYDAIARVTDALEEFQNRTRLPGMWPTILDASGCSKPVYKAPPPAHQIPVPGGETYMVSSEPVKVDPHIMSAAENAVKQNTKPLQNADDRNPSLGTVANPAPVNPLVADADSSLRHPMAEHPANSETGSLGKSEGFGDLYGGSNTNEAKAKGPLPPGSGDDTSKPSVPYGQRPSEPLPPQLGVPHQKRQLEDIGDLVEPSSRMKSTNTSPHDQPSHHQGLRQLETLADATPEEPECIAQGLESCSKNSPETYTLGGQSDSTFEYLPKMFLLMGGRVEQYKTMYLDSMKPITEKLLFRPMTRENLDILISGELRINVNYTSGEYIENPSPKNEHLTCFVGGMFAMGGKIFSIPEHVELGRKVTDGCVWSYNATESGIMPESFHMIACDSKTNCKWNETRWQEELDPYANFREEQRADWQKTYGVDDVAAYEKQVAAASSSSVAAEMAKATSAAGFENMEDAYTHAQQAYQISKKKRQLDDGPAAPRPVPAATPTSPPTAVTGSSDPWSGGLNQYAGPAGEYLDYSSSSVYMPPKPVYTPPPPPTHEEYVERKITDERLPPGFTRIDGKGYILRPEAIESVFYMYRITGEQYWRDMGWKMFTAIDRATRAPYGHASIDDITKTSPEHMDKMESFWIAETLKYFYLLFDNPDTWSLDDWVLNTEAHFFRRPENPGNL
ncbi:endoplasmic reticulum mannosidase MNL2 [Lecanosticta acicola]|uniref:alpha-1,2-Mannosidase n=1 Tax=Lecanosticta acicola TaxID=111012 RepID=A0AAI8YXR6_9PEZI|nr:endoplasmic reticulum mannosidase MNL2 [Lecanosticta acicola]